MIAFYGYTNLCLVNMINIKVNYFPTEKADLYIRDYKKGSSLSAELIDIIIEKRIFEHVYMIDSPEITIIKKNKHLAKLRAFSKAKQIGQYYNRILKNMCGNRKYEHFFINGGWNDTIYLTDYFYKNNPAIKISMVEEGTNMYGWSVMKLWENRYKTNSWKRELIEKITERKYVKEYSKCLDHNAYAYLEEAYNRMKTDDEDKVIALKVIDEQNFVLKEIMRLVCERQISSAHSLLYQKRHIIYFAEPYSNNTIQYIMLHKMLDIIEAKNIIVKCHTNYKEHTQKFGLDSEKLKREIDKGLYIDRDVFLFESLMSGIDMEKKVFITRVSAAAMYPKAMFNQEPYVILTYRLFDEYISLGDTNGYESYYNFLRSIYKDKDKIMVPNSLSEFQRMVKKAYFSSLGY